MSKAEMVRKIITENPSDPDTTYIIGDRKFDIEAGKENHIRTIAVTRGYGSSEELALAQPDWTFDEVPALQCFLLQTKLPS